MYSNYCCWHTVAGMGHMLPRRRNVVVAADEEKLHFQ